MEIIITNCYYSWQYSAGIQQSMPHFTFMCCCNTSFPSELSFRILHVSNFHHVELLMRIIALDNANATDALAETIHQQCSFSCMDSINKSDRTLNASTR